MNNKSFPAVSIIIPLYVVNDRFFEDLNKYSNIIYPNYEILVVSDKKVNIENPKIRLILTGFKHTGPAEKRDIAIKKAKGKICAFIDDDAYPDKNWLNEAIVWFSNKKVVAVGGPGITPKEDRYWQKISGHIIESYLCTGGVQYRFCPSNKRFVNDYPAYNLFVLTSVLKKVGGYGCNFYGGEDTFLCMKLIKYGDIVYDPKVLVYHHRRSFPLAHLRQISNVGLHRGYFFKHYPTTSRQVIYLLPTILTLGFLSLILLSFFNHIFATFTFLGIFVFWLLGTYSIKKQKVPFIESAIAGLGIILTHIVYGIYFIKGLIYSNLSI